MRDARRSDRLGDDGDVVDAASWRGHPAAAAFCPGSPNPATWPTPPARNAATSGPPPAPPPPCSLPREPTTTPSRTAPGSRPATTTTWRRSETTASGRLPSGRTSTTPARSYFWSAGRGCTTARFDSCGSSARRRSPSPGGALSLDAIEQGVLRGGRSKYGLGYLPRLPRRFERRYAVDCDPRIHFALNCGAESCPAIRAYRPGDVDDQLDAATRLYLEETAEYDPGSGVARIPRVFLWYRGDFGGGDDIRRFLREYGVVPDGADPTLRHRPWDWSKAEEKFA